MHEYARAKYYHYFIVWKGIMSILILVFIFPLDNKPPVVST